MTEKIVLEQPNPYRMYAESKLALMAEVPYLRKETSGDLGYTFASEQALLEKLRPAMHKYGFSCHPLRSDIKHIGHIDTEKGKAQHVIIQTVYRISHVMGYQEDVVSYGEAADTADKAVGMAMTHAQKYALIQWALIERGNDPDHIRLEVDSAVGGKFKRAIAAIKSCTTDECLKNYMTKFRDPEVGFTERQIVHLAELAMDRLKEIEANKE